MILKLLHVLLAIEVSSGSVVKDSNGQQGIHVSDFCPTMKYCQEGAHVLCMYYDPEQEYGPRCDKPRNMTITPELARYILDVTNAIRSKIANGKETGKNYLPLPRGYGIFRMKWDNELATFAQVLANQCVLRLDLCRATKKFSDPGQVMGVMKLTYPDWQSTKLQDRNPILKKPGLNPEKMEYIVSQVLMTWYSQKTVITPAMIEKVPNWSLDPQGRLFCEIVRGASTHMGCGITAYTELNYYQRKPTNSKPGGITYNTVLVVCNFSSQNKKDDQVFFTTRPPYSSQCGCPEGTQEDEDCLCIERNSMTKSKSVGVQVEPDTCSNPGDNCESNLVLLPIFTIEDAPPDKLHKDITRKRLGSMNSFMDHRYVNRSNGIQKPNSLELFDILEDANNKNQNIQLPDISHLLNKALIPSDPEPVELPIPAVKSVPLSLPYTLRNKLEARKDNPDVINDSAPVRVRIPQYPRQTAIASTDKKSSIFTRVAKFRLPNKRSYGQYDAIIPDVKPRKDFKNIERIANEYIKQRDKLDVRQNTNENKRERITTTSKTQEFTENAGENAVYYNKKLRRQLNGSIYDGINHYDVRNNESDHKIMNLLDNLEQEVKYIVLDDEKKELIDAKIKKIYEIVGSPTVSVITVKPNYKRSHLIEPGLIPSLNVETDVLESDIKGSKSHLNYDINHIMDNDHHARYAINYHGDDDRHIRQFDIGNPINRIKNYDRIEQKYKDDGNHIEDDIERKYKDRVAKYDDNIDYKNIPASRSQNNIAKYDNLKFKESSVEDRKYKLFQLYRGRETSPIDRLVEIDKNYYRSVGDNKKDNISINKREQNSLKQKENEDLLGAERKKYYQEKLANIERRLRNRQPYRRKTNDDKTNPIMMPRVRPNIEDQNHPRSKMKEDSFYVPDRAKFLHGF